VNQAPQRKNCKNIITLRRTGIDDFIGRVAKKR
jgi:hypothetical protein